MAEGKTLYPIRIVSPDGVLFEGEAELLLVSGVGGQVGFYAKHAPLVADLKRGQTKIVFADGSTQSWVTAEGFAMVHDSSAVVAVEDGVALGEIDVAEADAWITDARAEISRIEAGANAGSDDDVVYRRDVDALHKRIEWAELLKQSADSATAVTATPAAH